MRPHLFALRLLLIITDTGTDKQIHQLFTEAEQPIYYQFRAQGTANTEILDICGLEGSTRVITAALVPKPEIGELFILLENMFEIRKRGKGIALTLPITGIQASMLSLLSEEQEKIAKAHLERIRTEEETGRKKEKISIPLSSPACSHYLIYPWGVSLQRQREPEGCTFLFQIL